MIGDDLLFRTLTGRATLEERTMVSSWRSEAPENETRYHALRKVLTLIAEADRQYASTPQPSAVDIISLAGIRDTGIRDTGPRLPDRHSRPGLVGRRLPLWGGAGLLAAAAALVVMLWPFEAASPGPLPANEFATGGQEPANVVLSDGTLVRLAGLSRLRVPTTQAREVSLVGRAYFAVNSDPGRPFTVHTAIGDVRVLGTRFALEASEEDLRLTVVEGSVALVIDGAETVVGANQMARHVRGTTLPTVDVPSTLALTPWVGRFLAFRDTPLREVVQQVGEMYDIAIEVNPSLADKTLTAWFADWTLEEVVEAVCMVAGADCEVTEDLVTIAPRS